MLGLFEKKYFLGVDLGTSSIKAVEIKVDKNGMELVNFGVVDAEGAAELKGNPASREKRRLQYLSALLERIQPHTKEVAVSIPGSSGLIFMVELPTMGEEELAKAIQFEARKYVPIDLSEVTISWDVLRNAKKKKDPSKKEVSQEVLLVAALKKDIQKIVSVVEQAGCSIGAMELEIFSLVRALVGRDPGTHLLIDIGYHSSSIVLVSEGEVYASRGVDVGGGDITKAIMDGMGIAYDRAESLKKEQDFFHQSEIPLSLLAVENIVSEARRVQSVFERQRPGSTIDSILLSGGSAFLPGLAAYCSEQLKIPTKIGDPWKSVLYEGKEMTSEMKKNIGLSLSVAIGLALRSMEKIGEK